MLPLSLLLPAIGGFALLFGIIPMEFSTIGRAALASREGCELKAYRDSVGIWTIACGVTTASGLITVTSGLTITQAQADDLNRRAFEQYADQVRKLLKRPVTQEQFDALVSLNYNIGPTAFGGSTVLRRLNAGDIAGAADAILMWDRPAAIISRRQAEYDQFRTPYAKALPKGRRGDLVPVKPAVVGAPLAPSPVPAIPLPSAPGTAPKPNAGVPAAAQAPASAPGLLSNLLGRLATLFGRSPA